MKKHYFILASALLFAVTGFAKKTPGLPDNFKQQQNSGISFTENKGQVHDQNYNPRPDVLYGVMAGNMAVHIKSNGISYQLYRIDNYKEVEDPKTKEKHKEINQQTASANSGLSIYRIDLKWLNANTNFTKTEDEALPGYDNYYLESCPEGAVNVKSYKGITLNNLYKGINLHYYEKNNELKHDYLVAPHADYKQIQVQVNGAEISINEDGSLVLTTALGKVQEGEPIVYQNKHQLRAKWIVKNNVLSFDIENYNPDYELIIDPITRIWGTYYGGATTDIGNSCITDISGNVYLGGFTNSTASGTLIATTGSHQLVMGGGSYDAFLVKMNSNGIRLWATFYGGSGDDKSYSCATDAAGNVFMVGITNTNTGPNPIATAGSHQSAFGAVFNSTTDAFLVKFNANGTRQWGTYYGGSGDDSAQSCVTDGSGNIYLAGYAESNFSIATGGGHQPSFGGGVYDAFLAKFNTNGTRLWATYYGNGSNDAGYACTTDANGNVYLTGGTYTLSTGIATPGSHQPTPGGNSDAFLVKFNSNGARQWATYYGGTGDENGTSIATDASGNVYLGGETNSNTSTTIASPGSHQPGFGGSNADAFLVKFDASGVRQWATYYGGSGADYGTSCVTDASGNIYFAGYTYSNLGTAIASPGNHQDTYGGSGDAFLVKFDANGIRQSATYYGGSGNESVSSCAKDASGNIYLAGQTSSGTTTVIATASTHQSTFGGGNFYDAFLAKFDGCDIAPVQPSVINGPTMTCVGLATSYSTPLAPGANSYTLLVPGGLSFSNNSATIVATAFSSGVFTLVAGNACGASPEQTLQVTVNSNPTVTVNSGSICAGQSFTIVPSGADTYSYSAGPVVSPNITGFYQVTGTNTLGCSHTAISTVTVYFNPILTVNSGTICEGNSFTITPGGASVYTIQGGSSIVNPMTTTGYTVIGASVAGCLSSTPAVSNVSVNPLPVINVSTTNTVLCVGEEATLTASGALTYTFETNIAAISITISPGLTSTYTVSGTDANGCSNTAIFTQTVSECTNIKENDPNTSGILIFPNPTKGIINLNLNSENDVIILNAMGQIAYVSKLYSGTNQINLEHLAKGIYVLRIKDEINSKHFKIIKE